MAFVAAITAGQWISMGLSVGWLIGSWLFGDQGDKNDVFDPGAQEMPRFNQALRGATLAVLFGTNRVPSNIVWTKNFTVVRQESGGGAGGAKFGGSGGMMGGMGKGGAAGGGSITYKYKWDIMFHMGMTPEPYTLFGAWIGSDRLSSDTILAIDEGTTGNVGLWQSITNDSDDVTLTFDEAFYGPGGPSGDANYSNWAYFQQQEGVPCRWPYTVYTGFKQLDLGGSPAIPQISWEIGPGKLVQDYSAAADYIAKLSTNAADDSNKGTISTNGFWLQNDDTGTTFAVKLYKVETGANTDSYTSISTKIKADAIAAGLISSSDSHTWSQGEYGMIIPGTNYVLLCGGWDTGPGVPTILFMLYEINSSGTMTRIGGYTGQGGAITNHIESHICCGITGLGGTADPILVIYANTVSATRNNFALTLPSINTLRTYLDGGTGDFTTRRVNISTTFGASFYSLLGKSRDENGQGMWIVPYVDPITLIISTRLYFSINKDHAAWQNSHTVADLGWNSIVSTDTATYTNGFMAYLNLGTVADGVAVTIPSSYTIDNANFVDTSGVGVVPFSDAGLNRDLTAGSVFEDYGQSCTQTKLSNGGHLLIFTKRYEGSADLAPTGTYYHVRGFIYNPTTGKHVQYVDQQLTGLDTVADLGVASVDRYNYDNDPAHVWIVYDQASSGVYILEEFATTAGNFDGQHVTRIGTIELGGGDDVYPPYIIYQVLTNAWFGVGVPTANIDQTSYQAALEYCRIENIKVSTMYLREEGVLQIIELCLQVYGGFLIESAGTIKFGLQSASNASNPVRTIDNSRLRIDNPGDAPVRITKAAAQDTFNKVKVNYIDRNLAYRQNFVEIADEVDIDLHGVRANEFPPKFVMSEATAGKIAIRTLWSNLWARDIYDFKLGPKDADLEPGDVITLQDSFHHELATGLPARIVSWVEKAPFKFEVRAVTEQAYVNSSELAVNSQARPSGDSNLFGAARPPLYFRMYETPKEFSGPSPVLFCGYVQAGPSMGARLYVSADGVSFGQVLDVQPNVLGGTLVESLPVRPRGYMEELVTMYVFPDSGFLANSPTYSQTLALDDVGALARANGAGLIWINSEMMAYENLTLLAQNKYRFGRIYRGWGGTHIQAHNSGDYWFKHGGGIFTQAINADRIGTTLYYKVQPYNFSGVGYDISSIAAHSYQILGTYFRPQNPPYIHTFLNTPALGTASEDLGHIAYRNVTSGGCDVAFDWSDVCRDAGYGTGGYGERSYGRFTTDTTSHQWRIEVLSSNGAVVRSTAVSTTLFVYSRAVNSADFNGWKGNISVRLTAFNDYGDSIESSVKSLFLF